MSLSPDYGAAAERDGEEEETDEEEEEDETSISAVIEDLDFNLKALRKMRDGEPGRRIAINGNEEAGSAIRSANR